MTEDPKKPQRPSAHDTEPMRDAADRTAAARARQMNAELPEETQAALKLKGMI